MKDKPLKLFALVGALLLIAVLTGCASGGTAEPLAPTAAPAALTAVAETPVVAATEPVTEAPAGDEALTVFAAASLTDAFAELADAFAASRPGATVVFNFAGSNQLAAQVGAGAPADVFASANQAQMDAAVESGRIDAGAPAVFLTNRLVVVVPPDNPAGVETLQDLAEPRTLVVLAAEEVPAGKYALAFLDKATDDPAFDSGFKDAALANVVSYEPNVRSVLTKVALGEADAGIVYVSDAVSPDGAALGRVEIPDALNVVASYPIAVLNDSAQPEGSAAFVAFVLSPEGQDILAQYGFGPASR